MKATERALYEALFDELLEDEKLPDLPCALIDAALRGDNALSEVHSGDSRKLIRPTRSTGTEATRGPSVFLKQITVEGSRGAGPEAKLSVPPGPGLTLVVGRNGTGKSTFAEGLETVLTGTTDRSKQRKEWEDAWRNVGYDRASRVTATLMAEGSSVFRARWRTRTWREKQQRSGGPCRTYSTSTVWN